MATRGFPDGFESWTKNGAGLHRAEIKTAPR